MNPPNPPVPSAYGIAALSDRLAQRANELYHDLQATEFDEVHRRRHTVERQFWLGEVAPRLVRSKAALGLDLCSGTGFVPSILLPVLPATTRMLCLDLSNRALEQAKRSLGSLAARVTFYAGDAAAIPMQVRTADWIGFNAGLHHLPHAEQVLREADRVLKPGGLFCLGHEPNATFFSSRVLKGLERFIWNAFWYLSPRRNLRRVRQRLGQAESLESRDHLDAVNRALLAEGLISAPLTLAQLRQLVDVHTHGDKEHKKGFVPRQIIADCFPGYTIETLRFSDYGGQMLRGVPFLRAGFDTVMGALFREKGRLFSCILRKPSL